MRGHAAPARPWGGWPRFEGRPFSAGDRYRARRLSIRRVQAELRQRLPDLGGQTRAVETEQSSEIRHGTVIDEPIARDSENANRHGTERLVVEPGRFYGL